MATSLSGANFDEATWDAPEKFDITKERDTAQMTFGSGIHFCLGASLARMELAEALPLLARRMPDLAVDGSIEWKPPTVGIWGPPACRCSSPPELRGSAFVAFLPTASGRRYPPPKMSELPKFAGHTCWTVRCGCSAVLLLLGSFALVGARGSSASAVCTPVATASSCRSWRYVSTAGQSAALRTSFQTAAPYVRVAAAYT